MSTAIAICRICKHEIQISTGEQYRVVEGRPRCLPCCEIHGLN